MLGAKGGIRLGFLGVFSGLKFPGLRGEDGSVAGFGSFAGPLSFWGGRPRRRCGQANRQGRKRCRCSWIDRFTERKLDFTGDRPGRGLLILKQHPNSRCSPRCTRLGTAPNCSKRAIALAPASATRLAIWPVALLSPAYCCRIRSTSSPREPGILRDQVRRLRFHLA